MEKEILTDPMILFGPGGCPDCGAPLRVADSELTLLELNSDGNAISEETTISCIGVCPRCGKEVQMMRWKGGYIPYSRALLLIKKLELEDKIKERTSRLQKCENPLSYIGKEYS